jgi:hypothetical protein
VNQPVNRTRDRVARTAILVLVLALLAFWAWAFVIYEPPGNPDRLEDRAWPAAAEQRCARAVAAIGDLPAASQSPSPGHRADVIDEATGILDQLADDLAVLPGGTDDDRVLVGKWLDDWAVYLGDRATHAQRLRTEGDVRPYLTALPSGAGSHVERMNGFARVNDMESCLDPGDL